MAAPCASCVGGLSSGQQRRAVRSCDRRSSRCQAQVSADANRQGAWKKPRAVYWLCHCQGELEVCEVVCTAGRDTHISSSCRRLTLLQTPVPAALLMLCSRAARASCPIAPCVFVPCALQTSQAEPAAAAAAGAQWNVNISLTYYGRDARSRFAAVRGMMDAVNTPQGMCQFKVCDAVNAASRGAAAVAGAAANTTKTFSDGESSVLLLAL